MLNTTSRTALAERQLAAIVDTLMLEYDNDSDGRLSFQVRALRVLPTFMWF